MFIKDINRTSFNRPLSEQNKRLCLTMQSYRHANRNYVLLASEPVIAKLFVKAGYVSWQTRSLDEKLLK